jgi:glycosyltransferase 2 family protein
MGVPTNVGGWGPREGVAAWAFGAAGLGLDRGVTTAVVYGVMVLVASLPGAVVLVVAARRRDTGRPPTPQPEPIALTRLPAIAGRTPQGAARG